MAESMVPALAHPNSSISKTAPTDDYCSELLKRMNEYRKAEFSESLCDCILITGDKEELHRFPIHRVVLGACCEYFDRMFTVNMKEAKQDRIEMLGVDSIGLEAVISFAYSGKIESLTLDTFDVTMETAEYLGVNRMVESCVEFFENLRVTLENCLDIYHISEKFPILKINKKNAEARRFVLDNFDILMATKDSCSLSFNQLEKLLADNSLNIKSEYELFEWIVKWSEDDFEINREEKAVDLMKNVRFPLMSAEELEKVRTVEMIASNDGCSKLLNEARIYQENQNEARTYQENQNEQSQPQPIQTKTRSGGLHVVLTHKNRMPGIDTATGEHDIDLSDPVYHNQASENQMCVGGNFMYIYGVGIDSEFFFRCHLVIDSWNKLSTRKQKRLHYLLIAFNKDAVYAIGGCDQRDKTSLSLMEKYSTEDNHWTECCPTPVAIYLHCGVLCGNRIFISGGVENAPEATSTVLSYDPKANAWRREPSLNSARVYHSMFEFKERIYVAGGLGEEILGCTQRHEVHVHVETIKMFTPSTESSGTWTVCESKLNVSRALTIVKSEQVYFIMGFVFLVKSKEVLSIYQRRAARNGSATRLYTLKKCNVIDFSPTDDFIKPYDGKALRDGIGLSPRFDAHLQLNYPRGCCKFTFPCGHAHQHAK